MKEIVIKFRIEDLFKTKKQRIKEFKDIVDEAMKYENFCFMNIGIKTLQYILPELPNFDYWVRIEFNYYIQLKFYKKGGLNK